MTDFQNLKDTWQDLVNAISTNITLMKFEEGSYNADWDEGTKQYTEHAIPARITYEPSERDLELLGEEMLLDAMIVLRKKDLENLSLDVVSQDHFKINSKEYRITKIKPRIVSGENVGYVIGLREIL